MPEDIDHFIDEHNAAIETFIFIMSDIHDMGEEEVMFSLHRN